jgi:lipopolysaccharide/colanic/teichoic acid biosynthesis glycosyltransferase
MNTSKSYLPVVPASPWAPDTTRIGPVPFPTASRAKVTPEAQPDLWKRALDLSCLLLALPGLLVVMLSIAIMIKILSPGPVFFKQERIGFRRRRFLCWKFRTMKVGASAATHQDHLKRLMASNAAMVKMDALGDPRLIPGGRFLRATGLDELPQLINVLLGEMSLVGPRPCTPYELESYPTRFYPRFNALPGLTGLWQVNGKNKTTFAEMIRWDIQYARQKSFWLDLRIMGATLPALVVQVRDLRRK